METSEQKKDRERLDSYIRREQLASLMNETKWRELRAAILALPFRPIWRVQCLRDQPVADGGWDSGSNWEQHLPPFQHIEWLEIDSIAVVTRRGMLLPDETKDISAELREIVKRVGVPYSQHDNIIRIWGYQRPGAHMEFA